LNDSLTKTFGDDQIVVTLGVTSFFAPMPDNDDPQAEVFDVYYSTQMYINVYRTHSTLDLVNSIVSAIGSLEYDD